MTKQPTATSPLASEIAEALKFPGGGWASKMVVRSISPPPNFAGKPAFEIEYGDMYDRPEFNLRMLVDLGEILGTLDINVDDYSVGGCETCDYGSDYGHTLQIFGPTKRVDELAALVDAGNLVPSR